MCGRLLRLGQSECPGAPLTGLLAELAVPHDGSHALVNARTMPGATRAQNRINARASHGGHAVKWKGMPTVPTFYSVNETKRPPATRVYHNNGACDLGKQIAQADRQQGTNAYRLCEDCERLNARGK